LVRLKRRLWTLWGGENVWRGEDEHRVGGGEELGKEALDRGEKRRRMQKRALVRDFAG
jgi:hypothetical protein